MFQKGVFLEGRGQFKSVAYKQEHMPRSTTICFGFGS